MPLKTQREVTEADLGRLNIGRRYYEASLDGMFADAQHRRVIHRYCRAIHEVRREGQGLLLWGPNGRGKTFSIAVILKWAVSWGYSGYCILAQDIVPTIVESRPFEETALGSISIETRMQTVDFLAIDDLGKEVEGRGFSTNVVDGLLRRRSRERLPTIVSTNLSLSEGSFLARYGQSAYDIAVESLYPFNVKGRGQSERIGI